MVLANIEWIGTLCTSLSLVCATQLIIIGILAFSVPEVLLLTRSHISTAAGLIAGFITLPTALRLKTAQISPNMDRIYGYTLCYRRLAVCVSGALYFTAIVLAVIALITSNNLGNEFLKLMKTYHIKHSSKALVDNIQYVLQCCGGYSYKDWYGLDWGGYQINNEGIRIKDSIPDLLKEDTDGYPDLIQSRYDSVPFSCCKRSELAPCVHQNLIMLGPFTVNEGGCGIKLRIAVQLMLWFQFAIYSLCFSLDIAVLVLLKEPSQDILPKSETEFSARYNLHRKWENFSNADSTNAVLLSASHSQLTLCNYDKE